MQIQYINEMLQIPEVQINEILFVSDHEIHIEMTPLDKKQCCPIYQSDHYVVIAIPIADRFQVHGYVIEAPQEFVKRYRVRLHPE